MEIAQLPIGLPECVLGRVSRQVAIAQDVIGGVIHQILISVHEAVEGRNAALPGGSNKVRFIRIHKTADSLCESRPRRIV